MAAAGHLLPSFRAAPTANKVLSSAPHNPSPGRNLGLGVEGSGLPSCCQEPGASGLPQGQRLAAEVGEKAGWGHSPSFLAALGSKQQAAAPQDDPCERVQELLLAQIQALLGQQPPLITPELPKTSSVALVCGTEPSDTAPPAQGGCALPVPMAGMELGAPGAQAAPPRAPWHWWAPRGPGTVLASPLGYFSRLSTTALLVRVLVLSWPPRYDSKFVRCREN